MVLIYNILELQDQYQNYLGLQLVLFQVVLAIPVPLNFYVKLQDKLTRNYKNLFGILIQIEVNSQTNLGITHLLILLSVPVNDCGISLHLFRSSVISLVNISQFLVNWAYTFVRFITKYLIFFLSKIVCFLQNYGSTQTPLKNKVEIIYSSSL